MYSKCLRVSVLWGEGKLQISIFLGLKANEQ